MCPFEINALISLISIAIIIYSNFLLINRFFSYLKILMLSGPTQLRLSNYLKAIADAEISTEVTRIVLAEKKDFEPYTGFRRIDKHNKGYLTIEDVIEFLEEMDFVPTEAQVRSFFVLYDTDNDMRLSYSDFKNAVLPATNQYARELATNRGSYHSQELSYGASWALARVFEKEIQAFKQLEIKRQSVIDQNDWDISTAFNSVDEERLGYIDPEAIGAFFQRLGEKIAPNEIDALFRRGDKDADGKIDFTEFMKLLQPVNNNDRKVSLSPEKRSSTRAGFETPSKYKARNTSPIRIGSPARVSGTPQQLSSIKKEEPKSEFTSSRYKDNISQLNFTPARFEVSSKKISPRESRKISPRTSHRSSRSPSLKKEITDYRTESGYRTIKTYDSPARSTTQKGSEIKVFNESSQSPSRRSKSPRFKSDLTDYRISSNVRTIKTYDELPRQSAYSNFLASSSKYGGLSDSIEPQSRKKRSPSLRQEPTTYREETNFRTVRVYEYASPQARESRETIRTVRPWRDTEITQREPQSEIKKLEEKADDKKTKEEISKKLEFEQREVKPTKQQPIEDNKTPSKKNLELEKSNEMSFKKSPNVDVTEFQRDTPTKTGAFNDGSHKKSQLNFYNEQFLARAINQIVTLDKKLENLKNNLAICEDFTIIGAYKALIDNSGKGNGSKANFEENIRKLGVFFTQTELNTVFKRFDADGDGNISLREFENTMSPVSMSYTRLIRLRMEEQPISKSTLSQLIEFVKTIGSVEFALEDLRTRLSRRVSLEDAFKALDNREKGFIDISEFKNLLARYRIYLESKDLQTVRNRLDLNEDGRITSEEFTKTMSPAK